MGEVNRPEGPVSTVCDYTLTHLIRAVERGHDNFVFSQSELMQSFPWMDARAPCDVGLLAEALGPGWGVRDGMRNVLIRQCDKREALSTLRRMKGDG